MAGLPKHPGAGSITGQYFVNDDGSVKVPALIIAPELYPEIRKDLAAYQWHDSDFLLSSYPKNGTHFVWEVMTMLLHGSADYIKDPKEVLMIDLFPVGKSDQVIPSPRVLNTHYRTDVLSSEFRKGKTVIVMRNPKDACVSYFHHEIKLMPKLSPLFAELANITFADYLKGFLFNKDQPYGSYFDYTEYMWTLRDDPNNFVVFYEEMKAEPVATIQKVNEFMGTNASPELVQKIADATNFDKMKKAKQQSEFSAKLDDLMKTGDVDSEGKEKLNATKQQIYRKGGIGDWKNHFTVADNEMFDQFLASWEGGKDIPFKY